ncbi:5-(carboxyamino)imidazole ribonucleotide synthase [bacterium]|nr:5-(carboxyamino)imidazole ribonucleotide synthase [bacterium]|tara:strand:+ start:8584 stop:9714 length:1131 start_codon:yes stop_codon:yes gene_type:complete
MDNIVGIIGGGQLGKMLLQYCSTINLKTFIYDPNSNCPCKNLCNEFFKGEFMDYEKIIEFGRKCDIVTYELEHININALKQLENEGIRVYPNSKSLETIQNKHTQKIFFTNHNLPTSEFFFCENKKIILQLIKSNNIQLPCVWKKTRFGYDGFGVSIIRSIDDVNLLPECECILEKYIEIQKELSVIIARNSNDEFVSYPPVEMIFNNKSNQVEYVLQPAEISIQKYDEVNNLAYNLTKHLNYIGLLAIEMFLTKEGEILINELAPRPHNSGHLTIESCVTSQFEQHIRSILNLPLGETNFIQPSIMINLVGEEGYKGTPKFIGIDDIFKTKNTHLHIYGKQETRPNRKMGHITIIGSNNLLDKAKQLKEKIKIIS